MKLLTHEQAALAEYVAANSAMRKVLLENAKSNPKTSGALIYWFEVIERALP